MGPKQHRSSCGSYRDELLCVAMNTLLRAGSTGRTCEIVSTVLSAGVILHTSTRKEGKFRDPLEKGNKEETRTGREIRTREGKKGQRDGSKMFKKTAKEKTIPLLGKKAVLS